MDKQHKDPSSQLPDILTDPLAYAAGTVEGFAIICSTIANRLDEPTRRQIADDLKLHLSDSASRKTDAGSPRPTIKGEQAITDLLKNFLGYLRL